MSVRVRFAPSPTGYLHVGGLRTALYNYLFAKKNNGKLILRIEDTDRTRLVENATENLISSLEWAGIIFDESPVTGGDYGPYVQSQRLDIYKSEVMKLIDNGSAYYAFDTSEEIEEMRQRMQKEGMDVKYDRNSMKNQFTLDKSEVEERLASGSTYVIRLKIPDKDIFFKDIIRNEITVNGKDIDDQVLLKSDGFPTYHLANVVDDHYMAITHVIRGEEWLPSTPKHIILYDAFGWEKPEFAHLPLLLNKDKSKLSKRQGDVAVEDYIQKGYFKDSFVNFIALLGWNPSADKEVYSIDELISTFQLEKVNKAGAVFDLVKLDWMNSYYLRNIESIDELANNLDTMVKSVFPENNYDISYLKNVIILFKERVGFVKEILELADYMFVAPVVFDKEYFKKHLKENSKELFASVQKIISESIEFSHQDLHDRIKNYLDENGYKLKDIIHLLRLSITGKSSGAGMFETIEILGKSETLKRMDCFINEYFDKLIND